VAIQAWPSRHLARAPDDIREDREYRFARGALKTPDRDPTQTDAHVMRVACQASAAATGRLVLQLKTQRQAERQHQFHTGLAVAKQLNVGRFVLNIDGDRAVFAGLVGRVAQGSP
jgi:hypothetical protein